jgi:hypothetical protein
MMQSSDFEKKIPPISPSHVTTQSRASVPYVGDRLGEPNSILSPIYTQEMSVKDVSGGEKYRVEETPKTDGQPNSTEVIGNGKKDVKGRSLPIIEKIPEKADPTPDISGSGCNGQGTSGDDNDKKQGFLPVLQNRNFLALWGGQVFCQLADKVYLVLMIALINTQFQAGEESISVWVSALMMAFTIPAVLFGSIAGVFVDRWSKKTVLVATNVLRGILVLAIPLLLWLTHDWRPIGNLPVGFCIILGLTFLVSTLTQFFAPAEQSAIPLIVKEEDLLSANSLYTTTMMASVIVGFAVGEPLLAIADTIWLSLGGTGGLGKELVVGGSYAIAGVILLLLVTNEKPHLPEIEPPHIFADLRDGLRYFKQNHRLRK